MQYVRLVIQAIQSSICKSEAPKNGFQKMSYQNNSIVSLNVDPINLS